MKPASFAVAATITLLALTRFTPVAHAEELEHNLRRPHVVAVAAERPPGEFVMAVGALFEVYLPRVELQLIYRAARWVEIRGRVASTGPDWTVDLETRWGLWGNKHFAVALTAHAGFNAGLFTSMESDLNAGLGVILSAGGPYFRFSTGADFFGMRYALDPDERIGGTADVGLRVITGLDWNVGRRVSMHFKADMRVGYFSDYFGVLPSVSVGVSW